MIPPDSGWRRATVLLPGAMSQQQHSRLAQGLLTLVRRSSWSGFRFFKASVDDRRPGVNLSLAADRGQFRWQTEARAVVGIALKLAVESQQVVCIQAEAADRRQGPYAAMRSMPVVTV